MSYADVVQARLDCNWDQWDAERASAHRDAAKLHEHAADLHANKIRGFEHVMHAAAHRASVEAHRVTWATDPSNLKTTVRDEADRALDASEDMDSLSAAGFHREAAASHRVAAMDYVSKRSGRVKPPDVATVKPTLIKQPQNRAQPTESSKFTNPPKLKLYDEKVAMLLGNQERDEHGRFSSSAAAGEHVSAAIEQSTTSPSGDAKVVRRYSTSEQRDAVADSVKAHLAAIGFTDHHDPGYADAVMEKGAVRVYVFKEGNLGLSITHVSDSSSADAMMRRVDREMPNEPRKLSYDEKVRTLLLGQRPNPEAGGRFGNVGPGLTVENTSEGDPKTVASMERYGRAVAKVLDAAHVLVQDDASDQAAEFFNSDYEPISTSVTVAGDTTEAEQKFFVKVTVAQNVTSEDQSAHNGIQAASAGTRYGILDEVKFTESVGPLRARAVLRQTVDLMTQLNVKKLYVNAGEEDGGYLWARLGFNALNQYEAQHLADSIAPFPTMSELDVALPTISEQARKAVQHELGIVDPTLPRRLADLRVDGVNVGRQVLKNRSFAGSVLMSSAQFQARVKKLLGEKR